MVLSRALPIGLALCALLAVPLLLHYRADETPALSRSVALAFGALALLTLLAAVWLAYLSARGRALARVMSSVLDNVPDLISYVDTDQRYRFSNRAYHRMFGLSPERIYGRTVR